MHLVDAKLKDPPLVGRVKASEKYWMTKKKQAPQCHTDGKHSLDSSPGKLLPVSQTKLENRPNRPNGMKRSLTEA